MDYVEGGEGWGCFFPLTDDDADCWPGRDWYLREKGEDVSWYGLGRLKLMRIWC